MKVPVVIPYVSSENGQELRYSLRSLSNVTNHDGKVYVMGDKEDWFRDILYFPKERVWGRPYLDQTKKMRAIATIMPDFFIASMDDLYVTERAWAVVYSMGALKQEGTGIYQITKGFTADFLKSKGIEKPIDYECHAPMLVNRDLLIKSLDIILSSKRPERLQWRSVYGNLNGVSSVTIEDMKTYVDKLPTGPIISTNRYTKELESLFPNKSCYEN